MPADQRITIVVEDEPDAAEMFAEMMRLRRFRVLCAAGNSSAMSMLAKEAPAAVILDRMMPNMSGLKVLYYMRPELKMAKIPFVVVSTKRLPTDIHTGLKTGASVYLTKPATSLDIIGAAEKVLAA